MILNVIHRLLSSRGKTGAVGTDRFLLYKIFSIKPTSFLLNLKYLIEVHLELNRLMGY